MSDFVALQKQWTTWLRQPNTAPAPDIDPRRLAIYRELFFNNVLSFLESTFLLCQQCVTADDWQILTRRFFAEHSCQSPFFYDISQAFCQFLQSQTAVQEQYPWLLELAHFEWVELAADMAEAELPCAIQGDIIQQIPVLNPCVWPLVYQWPVHIFAEQLPPHEPPQLASCLLFYRTLTDHVQFMEITPVTARLVECLQHNQTLTGQQMLTQLAHELQLDMTQIQTMGQAILQDFVHRQIILGVKPSE
ncbi:DNA-binding domain-containing protein [Agitococcus lubricus]|uniref:Uncharacterized protein n=1 Tax=Agitococcus lubricus TaxID=1077255 RepID=A0A2T5IX69_9GAMM|nr:putative DNA-binding domain-containing protein [Agitococcus lubricus]PTQ88509.1 hypothetical protein C8N29_11130 [Agitococcus lubricus]